MKKLIIILFTLHASLLTLHVTEAQIIHVPADQPTIQAGIEAAAFWGDTVLVAEGTYIENIDFRGKLITVASHFIMDGDTNHINNTIIDGSSHANPDEGSVVFFRSYEDTTSVLCGFTITGGTGTWVPGPQTRAAGGIYINNAGAKIIHNHITENHITGNASGSGGGIGAGDIYSNATVIIRNNRITNNTIDVHNIAEGGGILIYCNGIIEDNIIAHNEISTQTGIAVGAGVRCVGAGDPREISISGNVISHNLLSCGSNSVYGGAGGMQAFNCLGTIRDNHIIFNENYSDFGSVGGGMQVAYCDTSLLLENNLIADNVANLSSSGVSWGGGICLYSSSIRLINNVITRNYAEEGAGIHIHFNLDGPLEVINNTIAWNQWNSSGGAIYLMDADAIVLNSILWNGTEEIYLDGGNVEVAYSNIMGGWPGDGNIDEDPEFIDDTCRIDEFSPCVDVGVDSLEFDGNWYYAPAYDLEGSVRPYGAGGIDIGAYECYIFTGLSDRAGITQHSTFKSTPTRQMEFRVSGSGFRV
ncbi:MAG: right-handed parallel beta-helix repeat-containing protein [Bacteroidales bacterium]|nr:right-handed parallel beta-helix repeat-containing protein [Bacteroidales bacterium]